MDFTCFLTPNTYCVLYFTHYKVSRAATGSNFQKSTEFIVIIYGIVKTVVKMVVSG